MAKSSAGDTILLAPGTFDLSTGGVDVGSGVTVSTENGPTSTILDMHFQCPGFVIQNAAVAPVIEGMTITHGTSISLLIGGGIICLNSSPVIRNCLFVGNSTTDIDGNGGSGAAIGVVDGSPLIEHNSFLYNNCGGGAVSLLGTSAIVRDNVFSGNTLAVFSGNTSVRDTTQGYAIVCGESSALSITHNLFWRDPPADLYPDCLAYAATNYFLDPQFCRAVGYPSDDPINGDWRVLLTSPLAPGGVLAGVGASLGTCTGVAARPTSWGRLKADYR